MRVAAGERTAVQVVLPAEGLRAQAAAEVLLPEATYFGPAAVLASCVDSFAAHPFRSASNSGFVKDAVGLALTMNVTAVEPMRIIEIGMRLRF